jgi:hypothetical protein
MRIEDAVLESCGGLLAHPWAGYYMPVTMPRYELLHGLIYAEAKQKCTWPLTHPMQYKHVEVWDICRIGSLAKDLQHLATSSCC